MCHKLFKFESDRLKEFNDLQYHQLNMARLTKLLRYLRQREYVILFRINIMRRRVQKAKCH